MEATISPQSEVGPSDVRVFALQLQYMNESQKRIEDLLKEFRSDMKSEIDSLRKEIKAVDERHIKNYQNIRDHVDSESRVNLKFRVKVMTYATVGSVVGAGVWQLIVIVFKS